MIKRSIRIAGHSTSVALEEEFWAELQRIAAADHLTLNALIARVDTARGANLSSALRVFVLQELLSLRSPAADDR